MANALYDAALNQFYQGGINLLTSTVKAVLVDQADYTPNLATHDFLDDIPVAARVATATLTSKTATGGAFDAADVTFTGVTGDQFELIVIYVDTGVETSSNLIALIDTATGLPTTPSGGDITIQWNAAGIIA